MRRHWRHDDGQIALPMIAALCVLASFLLWYLLWCRNIYWQMKMDVAADASALSTARAEAEMLNNAATINDSVNLLIRKAQFPFFNNLVVGETEYYNLPAIRGIRLLMQSVLFGFKTVPPAIGGTVARQNGAKGGPLYWPFPLQHQLLPQTVHTFILHYPPPYVEVRNLEGVYYARAWSPSKLKAQPHHRVTWLASRDGIRSVATARIWLDAPLSSYHNGGFPQIHGSFWHALGIQSIPPHFNARLVTDSNLSVDRLLGLMRRLGKIT